MLLQVVWIFFFRFSCPKNHGQKAWGRNVRPARLQEISTLEGVQKGFLLFFKEKAYTRVRAREKKCTWSIFYIIPKKQRKNTSKGTS